MTEWLGAQHPAAPARAAEVIRAGGLVILPTDTVYGLAADLWQPAAVAALYRVKQRPPDRAIPILLSDADQIDQIAASVPGPARRLAAAFWPGPLTLILPKQSDIPDIVSSLPTVGVRIPDHVAARAAIRACGGALAVTSANLSDAGVTLTAEEAAAELGEGVALVLDGGRCPGGTASTVADVSAGALTVLREGPISAAALHAALGEG